MVQLQICRKEEKNKMLQRGQEVVGVNYNNG